MTLYGHSLARAYEGWAGSYGYPSFHTLGSLGWGGHVRPMPKQGTGDGMRFGCCWVSPVTMMAKEIRRQVGCSAEEAQHYSQESSQD